MRTLLLILLWFASFSLKSQTSSINDGLWNNAFNWTSGVPVSFQAATVNNNMTLDVNLNVGNGGNFLIQGTVNDQIGGAAYDLNINGTGYVDIDGNVILEGNLSLRNSAILVIRSYDTLRIGGSAEFRNSSSMTIETNGVLIIEGDIEMRNTNSSVVNGNIKVGGDLLSRNSSTMSGTGNIETDGEIDIRNSSSIFGSTSDCNPGPCEYGSGQGLPISLLGFDANLISTSKVSIKWETASEINNHYFLIEHHVGEGIFKPIEKIAGAGNSNEPLSYHITIDINDQLTDHYFRLTQVDYDGSRESFKVIHLENKSSKQFSVFPNPSNGENLILRYTPVVGRQNISLINTSGRVVFSKDILGSEVNKPLELNLLKGPPSLPKGIYFLILKKHQSSLVEKLIIQ